MKDQDLKKWVARGQMSPSPDFTDQVMKALPVYSNAWKKTLYRRIGLVSGLSLLMVILSLYADLPPIQVFSHSLVVPRLAIIAVAAIFALISFCPYTLVSVLESSRTRRERTIKAQFTKVNEHFEDDRNDVIGLYRQTLIMVGKISELKSLAQQGETRSS